MNLSAHAFERLQERAPMVNARDLERRIIAGEAVSHMVNMTGQHILAIEARPGWWVFPVVEEDGTVVTVLQEGADVHLPEGKAFLRPPGLAPGLHNIEADRYHADPAERPSLSSGLARTLLAQSPRHAWVNSPRLNPHWQPKDSATFDVGRAAHRAILGRGGDWAVYPPELLGSNGAVSTKAAKEWEAETRARGITPLKADVEAQVLTMEARAREILAEHGITLSPLRSEIVAIAEIEGVLCRAMFDNVPEDPSLPIYDFKTCEDASPDAVRRSIMNYGYDFQAEWYRQVWRAATDQDRRFCFIFQEKKDPNEIAVVELTGLDLELTADRCAFARDRWRRCLSANDWPGYVRQTIRMELPEFYHAKRVEKMQMDRDAPSAAARRAAYDAQMPAAE